MYNLVFDGLDYNYKFINKTDQAAQFVDLNKTRAHLDTCKNVTSPFPLTFDAPAGHAQKLYGSNDNLTTSFDNLSNPLYRHAF